MICSSLNLLRFIRPSLVGADSTEKWRHFRGARQRPRSSPGGQSSGTLTKHILTLSRTLDRMSSSTLENDT
jgi:hypothetical protein